MDIKLEKKININSREKIVILFVLLILFLSCFFIYYLFTKESVLLVPRERAIFYTAQIEPYQDVLVTRAITVPNESVILSSERGGKIIEIVKQSAENVIKGDVIARLSNYDFTLEATSRMADIMEQINSLRNMRMRLEQDSRDTQFSLQEAQHQIDIISKDLRRYKILDKKFLIAKSELERQADRLINWKVKSDILQKHNSRNQKSFPSQFKNIDESIILLEKMMKMIEVGIEQLVIIAPIDGTLSVLDIELGQQIKSGEKISVIDNLNSYYFNVYFSEYYIDKIKPNTQIIAQINGQDTQLLIESVSAIVDNGKFKAKLRPIESGIAHLKRGQSIEIRIALQEENNHVLLVPTESVFSNSNGDHFIYIYQDKYDRAIKTKVEVKRRNSIKTEITSGLQPSQRIVKMPDDSDKTANIIEFK
ncbi:darobactin export ABC transporter periplasmic adaptor subunit [Yersinia pestis]|uniref:darobactin export ABC transporter periplasmic adaptor subunit n=1 Tax=Yersinia pestis TaxID=632 RepID=UPI00016148F1|nr:darobactin export ABC transporter periplasmic adaptor subunit [Yersinia pestis]ABX86620.1 efflux transporter, RND family, MFP subunit [Yersinia pestis Angola]AJJ82108.1 efflux transporter, RND family, MFP subunit [Yersinia pestis Angola]